MSDTLETATESSAADAPLVEIADATPPTVEPAAPVSRFTEVPNHVRILLHLPPLRRGLTSRVNSVFFYTEEFGRVDGHGRLIPNNGGMHVYEKRLLTLAEFMEPRVQKWLEHQDLVVRPVVRVLALSDVATTQEPAPPTGPSVEDMKALLDQIDTLRAELQTARDQAEDLASQNRVLGVALNQIEAAAKQEQPTDVTQPGDMEEPDPKPAKKAAKK